MYQVVSWVRGLLGKHYPEIMASLACFLLFFFFRFRRRDGLPTNWPVIGALPALILNARRVHEWTTEFLRAAPRLSYTIKAPWSSPAGMIIFTADPADVAHVFTANFGNYPKGPQYATTFAVLGGGIFNADGESWAFQRRKGHALLSDAAFRRTLDAITARKLGEGLVPLLDGLVGGAAVVDLQDVFMRLTFDLTAMFMFGVDPGCLVPGFPHVPIAAAMDDVEEVLFYRSMTPKPWLRLQSRLNVGHRKKMAEARKVLDASIAEFISLRRDRAADETETDLLTLYLACESEVRKEYGGGFDFDRFLRDTTLNLMFAGRDTTSSTLTWFFWLLSNHPNVEAKILAELNDYPPPVSGHRTAADLKCLVYLHAALSESLRLYPALPFEQKTAVRPDKLPSGARVGPGWQVVVPLYSMGRMEAVWGADCLEFRPERWLTATGTFRQVPSWKFVAFSTGPRTCLGRDLAFTQMKSVVAAVTPRFRMELVAGGGSAPRPKLSVLLHMKGGLKVRVHKRQEDARKLG